MRREFSSKTKIVAWARCQGNCEMCGLPIKPSRPEYHHRVEASLGGGNDLSNVWVLHPHCHRSITSQHSVPVIAKCDRIARKAAGIRRVTRKIPSRPFNTWAERDSDT